MITIRQANGTDILVISRLAHEIWPVCYGSILLTEQLNYMLKWIYAPAALNRQMEEGQQFLLLEDEECPVGFAAFGPLAVANTWKLHKLYVLTSEQSKGRGRALLTYILDHLEQAGVGALQLNVNKFNTARQFYEKMGFYILREEDIDIGQGYFMNDYIMEKLL